jgi:hypothetical protein
MAMSLQTHESDGRIEVFQTREGHPRRSIVLVKENDDDSIFVRVTIADVRVDATTNE